jgi:hypothetical protein
MVAQKRRKWQRYTKECAVERGCMEAFFSEENTNFITQKYMLFM